MDIFEVLDNRKTIRKFDSYIPSKEEIERIIESSPSGAECHEYSKLEIYCRIQQ